MRRADRKRGTAAGLLVLFVFAGLAVWLFYPYQYVLSFQNKETEEFAVFVPLKESEHFQIKFTHSIHLSDVIEEYKVKDDKLVPVQLIYEDTAVGMPGNASEGEAFESKDGKYYITGLKGEHDYIDLSVGQVKANHRIIYNDLQFALKDYVDGGTIVRIQPLYINNWELLRGVNVHEQER
ncbi:hypothetical protein GCM10007216_00140 [Thalassobacillus devorans]|uniref:DUF1850 domain-containing protein n=1 Tax=Thalassobacillus devorans TaxID=279813 RepID=A0ABQ1NDN2_9BACI|nr:DUF1850 domain-containing protein [Thalassobacillus devorans]NIK26922.1 hypothetical protein [Thalassobacillus devorans]GGC73484.1 hypothetical protein GCM10007216_00140 [Thalassobacillus devorans]